jgi:hypothetical protein
MPQSLKDVFAKVAEHGKFELADPDQEFQVTDVSVGQLPSRRLILAGSCDGRWFVHYERGGRGLGDDVLVFRVDSNGGLQFEWGGAGLYRAKNIDELRLAISSGKFVDDRLYYW